MPLNVIEFSLDPQKGYKTIGKEWSHNGVVGSGDMEVLLRRKDSPSIDVRITTPVAGFDNIWKAVLLKSVSDTGVGGISIEINDNNATPFVVATRLKQSFAEAGLIVGRDIGKDTDKDAGKDAGKDAEKDMGKDADKVADKDAEKDTVKVADKVAGKDAGKGGGGR